MIKLVGLFLIQFYPQNSESIVKCFKKLVTLDPCSIISSYALVNYPEHVTRAEIFTIVSEQLVYQPTNIVLWKLLRKILRNNKEKAILQPTSYFRTICIKIPPVIQQTALDQLNKEDFELYVTLLFYIASTVHYIDGSQTSLTNHPILVLLSDIVNDPCGHDASLLKDLRAKFSEVQINT